MRKEIAMSDVFFGDSRVEFVVVGPPVSEEQIVSAIPEMFNGKEEFIRFYLCHNGGKLTKFVYRDRVASDPESKIDRVQVESVFFIPRDQDETVPRLRSIVKVLKQRSAAYGGLSAKGYPNLQVFFDSNYPIGTDASDNTFWLEIPSGRIRYFQWECYEEGPQPIASSFVEFVRNFEVDPNAEQRLRDFMAIVGKRGAGGAGSGQ